MLELERKLRDAEARDLRLARRATAASQGLWEQGQAIGGLYSGSSSPTRRHRIRVMGCGALIEGATVAVKQGVTTVETLETDATGRCSFVGSKVLPYTAEVTGATGYLDSGPINVAWPDTFITLLPADGACVCGRAVPYGTMEIDDGVSVGAFDATGSVIFTRSGTAYPTRGFPVTTGNRRVRTDLGTITDNHTVEYRIAFAGDGTATLRRVGYFVGNTPLGDSNLFPTTVVDTLVPLGNVILPKVSQSCGGGKFSGALTQLFGFGSIAVNEL